MNENNQISFSIDLQSLEQGLAQVDKLLNNTFTNKSLDKFDQRILQINQHVQELRSTFGSAFDKLVPANLIDGLSQIERKALDIERAARRAATAMLQMRYPNYELNRSLLGPAGARQFLTINDLSQQGPNRMASPTSAAWDPWLNATVGLDKYTGKVKASQTLLAQTLRDEQAEIDANAAAWQTNVDSIDLVNAAIAKNVAATKAANAEMQAQYNTMSRMTPKQIMSYYQLNPSEFKALEQQFQAAGLAMNGLGVQTKSFGDSLGATVLRAAEWYVVWQGLYSLFQGVEKFFKEAVGTAAEFQQQMVLLHSAQSIGKFAGFDMGQATNGEMFNAASQLAIKYGDNINDVTQNLMLWYKTTGDLTSAIALSNESLKFQIATGTDLEDTYKTLTALSNQLAGTEMGNGDKTRFNLTKTHELLNMVYAAATVAGAGMRDVSASGKEVGLGLNNAAGILLHSLDQDAEALKKMGLTAAQVVAVDQALITSMGNTGAEADSAAERIARLIGGFAELSKTSKATALAKDIGADQFANLQKVLTGHKEEGQLLMGIFDWYNKLNQQQKNAVDTTLAGNRQYQIQGNLMEQLNGSVQKILKAMQDKQALDTAASQMNDTFNQQVKQLAGLWQAVATVVGMQLIPVLSHALQLTSAMITSLSTVFTATAMGATKEHSIVNAAINAGIVPNIKDIPISIPSKLGAVTPSQYDMETRTRDALADWVSKSVQNLIQTLPLSDAKDISRLQHSQLTNPDAVRGLTSSQILLGASRLHLQSGKSLLETISNPYQYAQFAGLGPVEMGVLQYAQENISQMADLNVLKNGLLNPPGGGGGGMSPANPKLGGGGKGIETPGAMANTALDELTNAYHNYVQSIQDSIATDQAHISVLEHKMQLFGPSSDGLSRMLALYKDENVQLQKEQTGLKLYQADLQKAAAEALKHVNSTAANTEEHKKWIDALDKARTGLKEVHKEMADTGNKVLENYMNALDAVNRVAKEYYDQTLKIQNSNVSTAMKNFEAGTGSLESVIDAYKKMAVVGQDAISHFVRGSTEWRDAMQSMADTGQQAIDTLKTKWDDYFRTVQATLTIFQGRRVEDAFSILGKASEDPYQKNEMEYYKAIVKYQQQLNELEQQHITLMKEAGGNKDMQDAANTLLQMGTATLDLDAATAEYLRDVQDIMDSGFFQALDKAIRTLGDSLSSGISDQLFGTNAMRDQIFQYDEIISRLQTEKEYEDLAYQSTKNHTAMQEANHKLALFMLDQEIKKQEQLKKAEEDRLNHPSVISKFAQTFTKGIIDDLIKQLEQKFEQGILNKMMPKQDQQLIAAMRQHVAGLQQNFKVPADQFGNMVRNVFDPAITQHFQTSEQDFNRTIQGPLQNAFSGFKTEGVNPFVNATTNFGAYVKQFTEAVNQLSTSGGGSGGGANLSSVNGIIGLAVGSQAASTLASQLDTSSVNTMLFGSAAKVPTGSGTGTVTLTSISAPAITQLYQAVNVGYNQQMEQAAQTYGALGGPVIPYDLPGNISVGATQAQILNAANSSIGGFGSVFLGLGGGGSPMGTITSGLGLIGMLAAASHQSNGGDIIGGSLVGMGVMGGAFAAGLLPALAAMGPFGIAAAIIGAGLLGGSLGGLFGPHYNPTQNPDMFANSGYGQGMANAMGNSGFIQALNGSVTEDPALQQALGGMDELQYLDAFVKAHPGGQGLSGAGLALWQQANALTNGGIAQGVGGLHQGNVGITATPGGNSGPYWDTQNWQQLLQTIDNTTQSVLQFQDALNQGSNTLIVGFNQFGSGMGFFPYVWSIPGYEFPPNPAGYPGTPGSPTSPGSPGSPGNPGGHGGGGPHDGGGGGGRGGGGRNAMAYTYTPDGAVAASYQPVNLTTSVVLDGRTVAKSTQSYYLQTARRGFDNIS